MNVATRNQLANVTNPFQGEAKKVLCVCSAGLLRSPTLANVLHIEFGYNTRAVGTSSEYALIPITEALIAWADEIVFVDESCKCHVDDSVWEFINDWGANTITLDTPDFYDYNNSTLKQLLLEQYTSQ